jgi:hypothetical protein
MALLRAEDRTSWQQDRLISKALTRSQTAISIQLNYTIILYSGVILSLHHQPAKFLATCKFPTCKIPNLQNSNLQNSQPVKFQPATCILELPAMTQPVRNYDEICS